MHVAIIEAVIVIKAQELEWKQKVRRITDRTISFRLINRELKRVEYTEPHQASLKIEGGNMKKRQHIFMHCRLDNYLTVGND